MSPHAGPDPRAVLAEDTAEGSALAASPWADLDAQLAQLQAAGAALHDPVGWHYLQTLAQRARQQPPGVQARLRHKLLQTLENWPEKTDPCVPPSAAGPASGSASAPTPAQAPSPLAALLQDMAPTPTENAYPSRQADPAIRLGESPRIRQLRAQLRQWAVQQQFSQAMALAPQNAGPINSHRLVLRALERMRAISPDYLQRFMVHLDTLMALHEQQHPIVGHSRPARPRKPPRA